MAPPPCTSIWGISYFIHNQTPLRLTLMTRSKSSSVRSTNGAVVPIPALLNAASRWPYTARVCWTIVATCSAWDTSVWTKQASPPAAWIISTVSSPSALRRAAITTLAPFRANAKAVALPIPELPPVTKATLPSNVCVIVAPPQLQFEESPVSVESSPCHDTLRRSCHTQRPPHGCTCHGALMRKPYISDAMYSQ